MIYKSSIVQIGKVAVGGNNRISVQSMTTTNTLNTGATVDQIIKLVTAGCDIVRVTTQNAKEAQNLINIKKELVKKGYNIPLVADVHFNPKVAEIAAKFVEKIRINPGNYINNNKIYKDINHENDIHERKQMEDNLVPLLKICTTYGTAIRIGVNHGSLSNRMLYKYGNTAQGMVESIMEFVHICNNNGFHNLILSLKASNVVTMIDANMLLVNKLNEEGINYPIHLGVTEAGSDNEGRIKSAAGIGYLLAHGIGDTIRVSLTEDPVSEIPVARKLVKYFGCRNNQIRNNYHKIVRIDKSKIEASSPIVVTSRHSQSSDLSMVNTIISTDNHVKDNTIEIANIKYNKLSYDDLIIYASVDSTILLLDKNIDGICIENDGKTPGDLIAKLSLSILQALGLRITKTEYIACPTCGRSSINVIEQLKKIKTSTSNLPGIKIAIMGCAVNGPGEMSDADYGFVGAGKEKVNIYKGKNIIKKNVPQNIAVDKLIDLINNNEKIQI